MIQFAKRYFAALLCLLLAMSGYSLFIVPAIEPRPRQPSPLPVFAGALGGEQWWQNLFPPGAWQTDSPQIFQSGSGVLLSSKWEQVGPKTLKLTPLTMILPRSRDGASEGGMRSETMPQKGVWIVSAEQGAVIHFENALDFAGGSFPAMARAELNGLIEITRNSPAKLDEHPLSVRTRDLSIDFDRRYVFTEKEVIIEWPDGIIQGHDMKLTLQGDLLGSSGKDLLPWGPLRTLELYHVDRIDMALANGGIWSGSSLSTPPGQPDLASLPARLQVTCGGRFTFDFTRSRATLVNGVHVVHQLANLSPDEFLSQEVVIDIEPPSRTTTAAVAESLGLGSVYVREIEATGVDSLETFVGERKVEVKAPTIGAMASAKRLKINLIENRIELDGKLNHAGATQSTAWLKYSGYEFTAPRIDYDADGNDASTAIEHLGYLIAQGGGEMRLPADSAVGNALVRWQDSLEMRPTETQGLQWVGLFGNVLMESALHGYMASDELEVWLRKSDAPHGSAGASPSRYPPHGSAGASPPRYGSQSTPYARYLPERLRAAGNITLSTEQIKAQVDELALVINHAEQATTIAPPNDTNLPLSDSAGRPMYQWVQPPSASAAPETAQAVLPESNPADSPSGEDVAIPVPPLPKANPMIVTGRSLNSTIVVEGDHSWIDNLIIAGPLDVTGDAAGPDMPRWHVVGDQLQMATNAEGQIDMQISGQPARVELAEGSLQGPTIRLDQKNNLLWMDQPGEFTIPTSAIASRNESAEAAEFQVASIDWFEPPHCKWQGHMLFDGRAVRIEGDIRFSGAFRMEQNQFWWISGYCEVLTLEFSKAIDLNDLKSNTAEPLHLIFSNNVNILASQLDQNGNKKSRQQLQLPSLTFDIQSNEITGLGPGSIRSWNMSQERLGPMASSRESARKETLQGAHLIFRDSMRGFLDRKEIYFQGKVELTSGPLASWDDAIDFTNTRQLTIDQLHLDCDLLKVYDTSGLSSTANLPSSGQPSRNWEFQAKGNVNFAGKTESGDYEGNGSEIAYVQAKERLMLWGEMQRPARIKKMPTNRTTEETIEASVQFAAINPRTLAIERFEFGQNGIRVDMPGGAAAAAGPQPEFPQHAAPDPRRGVSDFFQRK